MQFWPAKQSTVFKKQELLLTIHHLLLFSRPEFIPFLKTTLSLSLLFLHFSCHYCLSLEQLIFAKHSIFLIVFAFLVLTRLHVSFGGGCVTLFLLTSLSTTASLSKTYHFHMGLFRAKGVVYKPVENVNLGPDSDEFYLQANVKGFHFQFHLPSYTSLSIAKVLLHIALSQKQSRFKFNMVGLSWWVFSDEKFVDKF